MSLILDALRKLERDKRPRDPSVIVVGHVPWGGRDPDRRIPRIVLVAALVLAVAVAALWRWRPHSPSATRESPDMAAAGASAAPHVSRLPEPEAESHASGAAVAPPPAGSDPTASVQPPAPRGIDLPASGNAGAVSVESARPEDGADPDGGAARGATAAHPRPAAAPPEARRERSLRLTAISERDGHPVALLNDRLVREGDSFDGVRVLRIGPTEVEVEVDGGKRVIRF